MRSLALMALAVACLLPAATAQPDVPALIDALQGSDADARIAARRELAEIGPEAVLPLLDLVMSEQASTAQAARQTLHWLAVGWQRTPASRAAVSPQLLEGAAAGRPAETRRLALQLLGMAGDAGAVPRIAELLGDPEVAESAVGALQQIPEPQAVEALTAALPRAPAALQVVILNALGARGAGAAADDVAALLGAADESVRVAAAEALGRIGHPDAVEPLTRLLDGATGELRAAAFDALLRIARHEIAQGQAAQARGILETLMARARSEAEQLGFLAGLGELGAEAPAGPPQALLQQSNRRALRVEAVAVLAKVPGGGVLQALMGALEDESGVVRIAALHALGQRADPAALTAVVPFASAADAETRIEALTALSRLGVPAAAQAIAGAIEDKAPEVREAALAAYLAIGRGLAAKQEAVAARGVFEDLARRARGTAQWQPALDGLGAIGSAESLAVLAQLADQTEGLERARVFDAYTAVAAAVAARGDGARALAAYRDARRWAPGLEGLGGPDLKEAYRRYALIADGLAAAGGGAEAKDLYRAALGVLPAGAELDHAVTRLQALGEPVNAALARGFIADWWVIGTFPNQNWSAWDTHCFPEQEINLTKEYELDGAMLRWREVRTTGTVDLMTHFAGQTTDGRAAYCYAEFTVPQEQDGMLKMGSDDAIVCWLNGQQVHANRVDRGAAPDQDVVNVHFAAGVNRILLKILNNAGGWNAMVRACDAANRPLKFTQGETMAAAPAGGGEAKLRFEKRQVADGTGLVECCTVCDVNHDGRLDVVSGGFWYQAPDWTPHTFREMTNDGNYANDWADLALDVNGDGWTDVVSGGFHTPELWWYENPQNAEGPWPAHLILKRDQFYETMVMVDLNGDGQGDLLPNDGAPIRWYEVVREEGKEPRWVEHVVGQEGAGHGIGYGDVNLDGRLDILCPNGWYEAPADPNAGQWAWHAEWNLGATSVPILALDVNRDGRGDVIWGMGHDYGLYWLEQKVNGAGERTWERHAIDESFSEGHAPELADLDGDGDLDLIVGKRWKAHGDNDPGANDPPCIYWYEWDQAASAWKRWVVSYNDGAGIGLQQSVADLDGDGRLDIVSASKLGLCIFFNRGPG